MIRETIENIPITNMTSLRVLFKKTVAIFAFCTIYVASFGQINIDRVEPPNWWTGMHNHELQLMVHGNQIGHCKVDIDYPGVTLAKVHKVENQNYLFLDLRIGESANAGKVPITFHKKGSRKKTIDFPLKKRTMRTHPRGFDNSDVVYLLMPDRFANGDPENDSMSGMLEMANRTDPDGRHGGDIAGISDRLDYLKEFGATALWINPLLENNQAKYSYHGYAISDFYKTDPRFGTNQDYIDLVEKCHKKGMKVIQDQVFNHCGIGHWWMDDLPQEDWVHQFPEYTQSNFRVSTLVDPYASEYDRKKMNHGWFDKNMPDMNQSNPYLATYLIQNSIWWVETADIDGIRVDTYPYPDPDAMKKWAKRIRTEYPDITILGEVWVGTPSIVSYWEGEHFNKAGIQSVFDFPMYDAMKFGFTEEEGWNNGLIRLYDLLSQDYLYKDPFNHAVFVDNHDVERIYTTLGKDMGKLKNLLTFILTTRGIPILYYGTELLMTGTEHHGHGDIRKDFPGGWPGDSISAFENGRTPEQEEIYSFLTNLIKWRNKNPVCHTGKLTQFIPDDGVYVYFRQNDEKTVMVIINKRKEQKTLDTTRFAECLKGQSEATNIITGKKILDLNSISIQPNVPLVLEMINMQD